MERGKKALKKASKLWEKPLTVFEFLFVLFQEFQHRGFSHNFEAFFSASSINVPCFSVKTKMLIIVSNPVKQLLWPRDCHVKCAVSFS